MIFELFGMPGSGKSYICKKIEDDGYAKDIMRFYKENFFGKVIFHIFIYIFKINKELKKNYDEIMNILGDNSNYINIINPDIPINLYVKYIVFILYIEKKYFKKKNIIIDEGIIHYCIAIYAEYYVDCKKIDLIIDKLILTNEKKIIIGLNCSKEKTIEQIKKRNRKKAPIDFLEGQKLSIILERYLDAIHFVKKRFDYLSYNEIESKIKSEIERKKNDKI